MLLYGVSMSYATHIVGGVIYYDYLGNNRYKITFEIYKDCGPDIVIDFDGSCNPANPNCEVPPFYFGVYAGSSNTNIAFPNNSLLLLNQLKIEPIIVNPCLEPNNTCVIRGTYEVILTLPPNSVGYTIQYQRCCRNNGIANINNQPATNDKPGITLSTYIPPLPTTPNNSARFKSFPPIFICVGQQFYFDHSADDVDGDQLEYALVNPITGLSSSQPVDENPSINFNPVVWTPPYNVQNIIGGSPAMRIDSITGQLTCKPNNTGRFVVSVMVKERRNGVVIDSFARDFQYNVVDCDIPNADAPFIPNTYVPQTKTGVYVRCGDPKITFQNSSTNADRYLWNFGDPSSGANNTSTAANPTHVFSNFGTYTVTLVAFKNKSGGRICTDTTYRICYITPKPNFAFDWSPRPICPGQLVQFTNNTTSTAGAAISGWEWQFGSLGTSTVKDPSYRFNQSGTYNVKLVAYTNNGTCLKDTTVPIVVSPKPNIAATITPGCIGQPQNLICKLTVPAPSTISSLLWTLPNGNTFNTCNVSITPAAAISGQVKLWARTSDGCIDSNTFAYNVFPLPTIRASGNVTICPNTSTTLRATGGTSYSWSPPTFLSATDVPNPVCTPSNPITYTVVGTDQNGCSNSDIVRISLYPQSFIDAGSDTSVCFNSTSPNFRRSVTLNGQGFFRSQTWSPAGSLSNATILNPVASPTTNTLYTLTALDNNNCTVIDSVTVTVLDPSIDMIPLTDTFMCARDTIQIPIFDQGLATSYTWSPNNPFVITGANAKFPLFHPLDTMMFNVVISNYCYTVNDNVLINVGELPDPGLPTLDSICVGQIYQFRANTGFTSYLWTTNDTTLSSRVISNPTAKPAITYQYSLKVIDRNNCSNTDLMTLRVYYPPALSVLGLRKYLCAGDSIELTAETGEICQYLWRDARTLSSAITRTVSAFPIDTTNYTVTATNIHNCSTTVPFRINVQKKVVPQANGPVYVCQRSFVTLRAFGGLYYLWRPNYNINDTIIDTPQVFPDRFTTYEVRISNDCFQDSIKVDVWVDSLPVVSAGPDTTIYRGQEIELIATGIGSTWKWNPMNDVLTNPFGPSVRVAPRDTTEYMVELTNGRGCIGRDTIRVNVFGKNVLLVPTAFSPNRDGTNDLFRIVRHLNIREIKRFEVYNRWGQLVWRTTDINKGWDGTFKGQSAPAGVYVWQIEAVNYENEQILRSGNVTLIR